MSANKKQPPKPDAFWDDAAAAAMSGVLAASSGAARSNLQLAAKDAARSADYLAVERDNRLNNDVAITPTSLDAPSAGVPSSSFDVTVGGLPDTWVPVPSAPWITIISPTAGITDNGTVTFAVAANPDVKRKATIEIEAYGLSFTVNQDAAQKTKAEGDPNNPIPEPEPEPEPVPATQMRQHPMREVHREHEVEQQHSGKKKH